MKENEEQSQEEIIDEYIERRRIIQQTVDYFLAHSDDFFTRYNLPNAKTILYSIGTDALVTQIEERYKYTFHDWMENGDEFDGQANGFVFIFLLEKVFCSQIPVYPEDDHMAAFVKRIWSTKQSFKKTNDNCNKLIKHLKKLGVDFETNAMSEKQAQEHFKRTPELDEKTLKVFGPTVNDINDVSMDPEIEDADLQLLQGKNDFFETIRYTQLLKEFGDIFSTGNLLAEQINEKLIEKFKAGFTNGFEHGMVHTLKAFQELTKAYFEVNNLNTVKRMFLDYVFSEATQKICLFLMKFYAEKNSCTLQEAGNTICNFCLNNFGNNKLYRDFLSTCKNILKADHFVQGTGEHLKKTLQNEEEPKKDETEKKFNELTELINSYISPEADTEVGDFVISSQRINIGEITHYLNNVSYCLITLIINTYEFDEPYEVLFMINRYTGELTLANGNLEFSEFLDRPTYSKLKIHIYDFLIKELKNSREAIPEIIPKMSPIQVIQKSTEQLAENLSGLFEQLESAEEPKEEISEDQLPEGEFRAERVAEGEREGERAVKRKRTRMPELNGTVVFRVLAKILGQEPVKPSGGSHFHIPRKNGEGTYPLPFHKSDSIGKGILLKCLREVGISRQEFLDNL